MKLAALLAVGVLVALPWIVSSYAVTVLIFVFFYAYLGQAWNIVGGYAGQLSAGHAAFVGVGGYVAALEHRRFGEYLKAIREDENACEALGVNTFKYKMLAMVVSSFLTGVGGTFYAYYLFSLQPNSVFGIPLSVEIIIRPIVGGAGTVLGPILGSFILSPLGELSRIYLSQGGWSGLHLIVYGLLLIVVVLFFPQGAYPTLIKLGGSERKIAEPRGATPPSDSPGPKPPHRV